jgi:hypothetical protein
VCVCVCICLSVCCVKTYLCQHSLIYLNGKQLELGVHNDLPVLTAVQLSGPKYIEVPPLTYGFYVITNANAKACLAES